MALLRISAGGGLMRSPGAIASAQLSAGTGGGGYVGPLDLVSGAIVAYSSRALSAADRGSPLYTLREDSGNTTQSFNSDETTGASPVASITAFLNGAGGFVASWKDQSGNAYDLLQAASGRQPGWREALNSARPSLLFSAANSDLLATASSVNLTNPGITVFTVMAPVEVTASGATTDVISGEGWATSSGGMNEFWNVNPDNPSGEYGLKYLSDVGAHGPTFDSLLLFEYNDGLVHIWDLALDGSVPPYSGVLCVDGESFSDGLGGGEAGFNGLNWPMSLGNDDSTRGIGSGSYFDGQIFERIVYPSTLSDADRLAIRQNIASHYEITLS